MITAFMKKWRHIQIAKLKKEIEHLIEENILEEQGDAFVYIERGTSHYVVIEKQENGFLCTLIDNELPLVTYQIQEKHVLFDKVNEEYTIWQQINTEGTTRQLQGLSKNQQVKYQKLVADSIR